MTPTAIPVSLVQSRLRYDPDTGLIFWREGERLAGRQAFTYGCAALISAFSRKFAHCGESEDILFFCQLKELEVGVRARSEQKEGE